MLLVKLANALHTHICYLSIYMRQNLGWSVVCSLCVYWLILLRASTHIVCNLHFHLTLTCTSYTVMLLVKLANAALIHTSFIHTSPTHTSYTPHSHTSYTPTHHTHLFFGCSINQITDMNRYATVTYQLSDLKSTQWRRTLYCSSGLPFNTLMWYTHQLHIHHSLTHHTYIHISMIHSHIIHSQLTYEFPPSVAHLTSILVIFEA